jgi:hypothetical protein
MPTPLTTPATAPPASWGRRNLPLITLIFLAFGIPELLTGSTTVPGLVLGLNLLLGLPLYGSGVVLVRESALRWNKGWVGILLLGLAYGIVEEGIATKTMVDPSSSAAGVLGTFGHFLGVNWIFAVQIDIFHAVFSIALPILLVSLLWPARRTERFVRDRGLLLAVVVLSAEASIGYIAFTRDYFPAPGVLAFLLATIGALVLAFFLVPVAYFRERTRIPTARPRQFGFVAGGFVFGLFALSDLAPVWHPPPFLLIVGILVLAGATFWFLVQRAGFEENEVAKIAFAAGLLSFWVPWDIALEIIGDTGVLVVLGLLYFLLYRLYRRYETPVVAPPRAVAAVL